MAKNIDFKKVASWARFGMLASLKLPTPADFEKLSEEEKLDLFSQVFDLHHDLCNYLASYLDIDELQTKYNHD